jgi:hypothetical protein
MPDLLRASRCPRCRRLVVPPASLCPDHPVKMEAATLPPLGEVVSFTTLHSPPEGFRAPSHSWLSRSSGARLFCHGAATDGVGIGPTLGGGGRPGCPPEHGIHRPGPPLLAARQRAQRERIGAIGKSVVKGIWNRRPRGDD